MNDKKTCQYLLENRIDGFRFFRLLKRTAGLFMLRIIVIGLLFKMHLECRSPAFAIAGGILIGALLQDLGWFWEISKSWPLTERITDWKKVDEIAKDEAA